MSPLPLTIKEVEAEDTWSMRHQVMWPDQPFDFVKVPNDEIAMHFGLYVANHLITVVSLFISGDTLQFRKLATEVSYQGQGYGQAMMKHVIAWARQQGSRKLRCNARADKTKFYEKFNMIKTDQTFEKGGIVFVIMELDL